MFRKTMFTALALAALVSVPANAAQLYWTGNYYDTAAVCLADAQVAMTNYPGMIEVQSSQWEYRGGFRTNTAQGVLDSYVSIACIPYTSDVAGPVVSVVMVASDGRPDGGVDTQAVLAQLQAAMDPLK